VSAILTGYSSLRNQKVSPLLRLPAELRNKIYGYAFSEVRITPRLDHHSKKFSVKREDTRIQPAYSTVHRGNLLALLLVCRQIHAEAALLPFHEFQFNLGLDCVNTLNLLMDAFTKKQRETIRHIMLDDYVLSDIFRKMTGYWRGEDFVVKERPYDSYLILQQLPGLRLVTFEVCVSEDFHPGSTDRDVIKVALKQIGAHTGVEVEVVMVEHQILP
jgi:hypothetical protein